MSKIRHRKRIMPKDGLMVSGVYKSDYDQGVDDAFGRKGADLGHMMTTVPLCESARSKAYWAGYKRGLKLRGFVPEGSDVGRLRTQQMRVLIEEVRRQGVDVDKYLADGGRIADLLSLLNARGRDQQRAVYGRNPNATARA